MEDILASLNNEDQFNSNSGNTDAANNLTHGTSNNDGLDTPDLSGDYMSNFDSAFGAVGTSATPGVNDAGGLLNANGATATSPGLMDFLDTSVMGTNSMATTPLPGVGDVSNAFASSPGLGSMVLDGGDGNVGMNGGGNGKNQDSLLGFTAADMTGLPSGSPSQQPQQSPSVGTAGLLSSPLPIIGSTPLTPGILDVKTPTTSAAAAVSAVVATAAAHNNPTISFSEGLLTPKIDHSHEGRVKSGQKRENMLSGMTMAGDITRKSPDNRQQEQENGKHERVSEELKKLARSTVMSAWKTCSSLGDFVGAVRKIMPPKVEEQENNPKIISANTLNGAANGTTQNGTTMNGKIKPEPQNVMDVKGFMKLPRWKLEREAEAAILETLMSRLTAEEGASTRVVSYLRHSVMAGLVSQNELLAAIVRKTSPSLFPGQTEPTKLSSKIRLALAQLTYQLVPHYSFSKRGEALTEECTQYLAGIALILSLPSVHLSDRMLTLARAVRRRNKKAFEVVAAKVKEVEERPGALSQSMRSAIRRLRRGLSASVTPLESIAASGSSLRTLERGKQINNVITESLVPITTHVLGADIANSLAALWAHKEPRGGDLSLLTNVELAAVASSAVPPASRYVFHDRIRACEAIIHHLYDRASNESASQGYWASNERLKRLLRDSLPQVRKSLKTEFSCLMVAAAVIGAVAICIGPPMASVNSMHKMQQQHKVAVFTYADKKEAEMSDILTELCDFAVSSLEEAAESEDAPAWRGFGVWLLLLASRCGNLLQLGKCDHVRAANVLRGWSRMSGPKLMTAVGNMAASVSLSITDASDKDGSDETLYSICKDLVQ